MSVLVWTGLHVEIGADNKEECGGPPRLSCFSNSLLRIRTCRSLIGIRKSKHSRRNPELGGFTIAMSGSWREADTGCIIGERQGQATGTRWLWECLMHL